MAQNMKDEEKTRTFELPDGRRLVVDLDDLDYIFKGYRPRLMALEDFKYISKILKKELKNYLKGTIIHLSKVSDEVWGKYTEGMKYKPRQKGKTYIKKEQDGENG
jgi:hypothetical protein